MEDTMAALILWLIIVCGGGFMVLFTLFMLLAVTLYAIAACKWPEAADSMTPLHIINRLLDESKIPHAVGSDPSEH